MSSSAAVRELAAILGGKLTAYVAGVSETRAVRQWAEEEREPQPDTLLRIREALIIALTLAEHDDPRVVQAWFRGLNPQLDDRAPATLLREGNLEEAGREVRMAARAFLAGG